MDGASKPLQLRSYPGLCSLCTIVSPLVDHRGKRVAVVVFVFFSKFLFWGEKVFVLFCEAKSSSNHCRGVRTSPVLLPLSSYPLYRHVSGEGVRGEHSC